MRVECSVDAPAILRTPIPTNFSSLLPCHIPCCSLPFFRRAAGTLVVSYLHGELLWGRNREVDRPFPFLDARIRGTVLSCVADPYSVCAEATFTARATHCHSYRSRCSGGDLRLSHQCVGLDDDTSV